MAEFLAELVRVDEAVEMSLRAIGRIDLEVESVSVWRGLDRVLAEEVYAPIDHPSYSKSYVDGYAVRAADVQGSSPYNPAILRVKGTLRPSDGPERYSVERGETVEVYTGSPLPVGADAVVMHEDAIRRGDYVEIVRPVPKYSNVSLVGEDYKRGELLVSKSTLLKPQHLAIIASAGLSTIRVYERVRVGILCSGSEVIEPGHADGGVGVYNSTGVLIKSYLDQHGFLETKYYGIYPDSEGVVESAILRAVSENHIVVTSGGAGFSDNDVVFRVISRLGRFVFRGVAMRPGKPTSLAIVNSRPIFVLSGYPVAAWTALEAIVVPVVHKLLGLGVPRRTIVRAKLKRRVPNAVGFRSYVRVRVFAENGEYFSDPYMIRGSGILSSLVRTNGYVVLPEDVEGLEEGEVVDVHLY